MIKYLKSMLLCLIVTYVCKAQETFPINGVKDKRAISYALTGAKVHVSPTQSIDNATLIIADGKVTSVIAGGVVPSNAVKVDMNGLVIYPSFIDPYSTYGMPEVKKGGGSRNPQMLSKKPGAYNWNEAIKAEVSAAELFRVDSKAAEAMRKQGFGSAVVYPADGIVRGRSAFVSLAAESEQEDILLPYTSLNLSLDKGSSKQDYPSSMMGAIALLRQTYMDAKWYAAQKDPKFEDLTLRNMESAYGLPQVIESPDRLTSLRVDKVGDEFGYQYIIKGSGDEYQRIKEIKATAASFILPLTFPKAYDVSDPFSAMDIDLQDMRHWELAPTNASVLASQGVEFAFTPAGLENGQFLTNLRKSVEAGLSKEAALKALTTTPAKLFGLSTQVGTLTAGKLANFIVVDKDLFEKDAAILENWIEGEAFVIGDKSLLTLNGLYDLKIGGEDLGKLKVEGFPSKAKATVLGEDTLKASISVADQLVTINIAMDSVSKQLLSGYVEGKKMSGNLLDEGEWKSWSAIYSGALTEEEKKEKEEEDQELLSKMTYPFVAFGWETKPEAKKLLFKNATVWTNEADGVLEETDVLIANGKIISIGKNLSSEGAEVIDATGKHLTSGIIDEHSHIAISKGVNEAGQAVSAEVRIGDVVNSEDINIYRQLAGGVTAAQLLHGSANPIGGQSALIKMRWGMSPEEMKIQGADGFIKFALGENVKQSNWGDTQTSRFPQTRMGVEQTFRDGFNRALEYQRSWSDYNALSKKAKQNTIAPRKDLELETLVEIINSKRFVTCHSYVQSEINMLMHVAEDYDFRINTFTHILEGYKVADKMKAHGVGGSTFSDWWAYKFEVREAIPYNASLMNGQGIVTAINSDDAEMGRRLNQEAAKSVKYGGMSEEEAWKMVTLNPAKLLHLDDKMGSVKAGKDADLVLWSDHPLSIYAKAEKTLVDGVVYFDIEKDKELQQAVAEERAALVQKLLGAKKKGAATQKGGKKVQHHYHCDDISFHYMAQ